jgi:hypothetical protein
MESIFSNLPSEKSDMSADEYAEIDNYEARIKALISDAADFNDSDLSPEREENLKMYYGLLPALSRDPDEAINGQYDSYDDTAEFRDEANRATVVSTDVRDTVMAIMPSLIRIFTSSENIADFVATSAEAEEMTEQATHDVLYTFWEENPGFLIIHTLLKDALTEKIGVVRWQTHDNKKYTEKEFLKIREEQVAMILEEANDIGNQNAEVKEMGKPDADGFIDRVVIGFTKSVPSREVVTVPPENFRISRRARTIHTAPLVGVAELVSASDVVELGYPKELVHQYTGNYDHYSPERSIRNPSIDFSIIDDQLVEFGDYFIRIDKDGDGIDELRRIRTIGSNWDILEDEIVDDINLAVFCGDPRPHTVIGDALADLIKDIQEINTALMRGALDSLSGSMFPDIAVNENMASMNDILAPGVGRVLRMKGDPSGIIKEIRPSFIGRDVFEMIDRMNMTRQSRTGISEASKGVDPKALQSTNLMGIEAIVTGAQERIELIARILAETGFKDLMRGLLREIVRAPNRKRSLKREKKWVEYDQSIYDPDLMVKVNPSLGRGNDISKMMTLQTIQQTQMMIIEQMGLNNPFVTPSQYLNTIKDQLALVNIRNSSRYFNEITEEVMAQISGPKEPTPEEKIATAEVERVKATTAIAIDKHRVDREKMAADDDFRRDKLGLDTLVKLVTSMAEYPLGAELIDDASAVIDERNQP